MTLPQLPMLETLKRVRPEIDAALAEIAKRHGMESLKLGRITYDRAGSFSGKIEGVMDGGASKEAQMYEVLREYEGLPPLGTTFENKQAAFTIIGANRTGSKIIATAFTGQRYLFSVDAVRRLTGGKAKRETPAEHLA